MSTNLMALLTLVEVVALFGVLIGFVRHLTQILSNTGDTLAAGVDITTNIRRDCEDIVTGVLALNKNLNAAAAGLNAVTDTAQRRAASRKTPQPPRPEPRTFRPPTAPETKAQGPAPVTPTRSLEAAVRPLEPRW